MVTTEKNGWIKLHRKILDNPIIMKDADHLSVWMYLLLNATHAEYPALFKGQKIMLHPGQLITGRKSIASKLLISESKVTRILNLFESEQQIEQQTSNKNRLISVVNWDFYQASEQQNETQVNNKWTTSGQQVNTNKKNKNGKKNKNEINNNGENPSPDDSKPVKHKYGEYKNVLLTDDELKKLKSEYSDYLDRIERLSSYVASTGKAYKSHYATIRSWARKDAEKPGRKEMVPSWMGNKKKSGFNSFQQNQYDFGSLEDELLANGTKTAGNDPDVAARAEALKRQLGGA